MNITPTTISTSAGLRRPGPPRNVLAQCEDLLAFAENAARLPVAAEARPVGGLLQVVPMECADPAAAEVHGPRSDMLKVVEALSSVVRALNLEAQDTHLLNHQFAAAIEQQEASRHASLHDVLTGLPNRALFNDRLDRGLAQARRLAWSLALMFIDLDAFKKINDEHGHAVGDGVLQTIATRLKAHTRLDHTVSRHGGDEFMYLALGIRDVASASVVAEKLVKIVDVPCPVRMQGRHAVLTVKASVGISIFPVDGTSAEELITRADGAMYRAKRDRSGHAFA